MASLPEFGRASYGAFRPASAFTGGQKPDLEGSMPFDGQNAALTLPDTLAAALIEGAVETVEPHVLEAHKAHEQQRYPAGWFYRHRVAVQITSITLLSLGTVAGAGLFILINAALGVGLWLLTLAFAIAQSAITVRGPALWRERAIMDLDVVHPAVRASAERLQERLPGVSFRLGELIQDRVTLDPYLLAEYGNERAILGIWDGDRLISPRSNTTDQTAFIWPTPCTARRHI
jgi:hypothetical protein